MLNTSPLTEKLVALHLVNPKMLRVVEISRRNESVAPTKDGRTPQETIFGRTVLNTCLHTIHGTALQLKSQKITPMGVSTA
jgi:hypothetical protein